MAHYFTTDLRFGQVNIIRHRCRPFSIAEQLDAELPQLTFAVEADAVDGLQMPGTRP